MKSFWLAGLQAFASIVIHIFTTIQLSVSVSLKFTDDDDSSQLITDVEKVGSLGKSDKQWRLSTACSFKKRGHFLTNHYEVGYVIIRV